MESIPLLTVSRSLSPEAVIEESSLKLLYLLAVSVICHW